eukprot:999603-Pelagomonas_calceolata.AAC.1
MKKEEKKKKKKKKRRRSRKSRGWMCMRVQGCMEVWMRSGSESEGGSGKTARDSDDDEGVL